eukprot:CAMPEP_0194150104 /NCGR_PEP_ID=MMETSP0152-20130528/41562_1 /TAXON_ID=1049557 /ORGANISM="Thalassiothrix antarctica, Strain L6-D1" /LENGTH=99 /DNA_ID=CAMNT_0038852781 /DNA_START=48 /DNA_END=344 /DNA_ORIENTATION=+
MKHHGLFVSTMSTAISTNNVKNDNGMRMFLGQETKKTVDIKTSDTTKIGKTVVPSIGIGTISWSSDSLTKLENLELQSLVNTACRENAAFFDTAERYGS